MKKRFTAIFTITIAAVLISSIAYAAKKKLRTKSAPLTSDVSEVDLAAGLLDANGDHKHKSPKASESKKQGDVELKDLIIAKLPKNP
jgi:hypothetical protein